MQLYNKTILCVDDDEDDLTVLREAIETIDTSFKIVEAYNGVHALEVLEALSAQNDLPCLIVLDINMPRMDGKRTLTQIKNNEDLKTIPLVLFSTSNNPIDQLFCAHYGVELVTKPSSIKSIQQEVKKLLQYCA